MQIKLTEAQARLVHFCLASQLPMLSEEDRRKALALMGVVYASIAKLKDEKGDSLQ